MPPAVGPPVPLSATPRQPHPMGRLFLLCPSFVSNLLRSFLPGRNRNVSPTESQDRLASPSGSSGGSVNGTEDRADTTRLRQLQREVEDLKGQVESRGADVARLRRGEEELIKESERKEHKVAELEREIGRMRSLHREDVQKRIQHTKATEERLNQTEELLATRSAELTGAQAFLSTTDALSEAEVLGIVRDLNENIYQAAVKLTEEWEALESPEGISSLDVDPVSQSHVPTLVQLVRNRNPMGLTFLLQSCLCSLVVDMTSSWGYHPELAALDSVYQRISASEGQAVSARWRSLTHNNISQPPPHSALLVERLANVFDETGSFPSTQQSLGFVERVALEEIESIIQLSLRSELAFRVEVMSSDMTLLFEAAGAVFDGMRMTDEFGSDGAPIPEGQDRIAGTTEVGVGKSVSGGPGESRRAYILLKTKVVLEKDVREDGE